MSVLLARSTDQLEQDRLAVEEALREQEATGHQVVPDCCETALRGQVAVTPALWRSTLTTVWRAIDYELRLRAWGKSHANLGENDART